MKKMFLGLLFALIACSTEQKSELGFVEPSLAGRPIVIGHRGSAGYLPEHTIEGYRLAIANGADYIEPDLVATKDGVLIARHENEISGTTDVASKFPGRKKTKMIDGEKVEGWFTEDFTLREIKRLRAKERLEFRSHAHDGKYKVPTFEEILNLVRTMDRENAKKGRRVSIGVYPELKHPSYFKSVGLPLEERLVKILRKKNLNRAESPIFIQCFEVATLKRLHALTPVPLIQLIEPAPTVPYDFVLSGDPRTVTDLISPKGLAEIATYAKGIGPYKRLIRPEKGPPTSLIHDAHAAGLLVHPYTFRNEESFLIEAYEKNPEAEYLEFFSLGVDGVFTDFVDTAVGARSKFFGPGGLK